MAEFTTNHGRTLETRVDEEVNQPLQARIVLSDPHTGLDLIEVPIRHLVEIGDTVTWTRTALESS
jgi:hypothetical protein